MTNDKGILIQNIYYMLSYAFQVLKPLREKDQIAGVKFESAQDLFAAILARGTARQLKQGLHREYTAQHENRTVLRGKLDLPQSVRLKVQRKHSLACEFDELSENNLFNQILKTTLYQLLRADGVAPERRDALRRVLLFFDGIALLPPPAIPWKQLHYQRNNQNYEMLMNLCWFVLDGMLQTTEDGSYQMTSFADEHMERLYEKFLLAYYQKHHPALSASPASITWNLTGENNPEMTRFLPGMKTDITLHYGEKTLIIDAKYYKRIMQQRYNRHILRSDNLYQIFAYVKNMDTAHTGNVSGLLLYAKTEEAIVPEDYHFQIDGSQIGARTLDLNTDFSCIRAQLDSIAAEYFAVPK